MYKHKIGPIHIPSGNNTTVFRIPERQFLAGKEYIILWYNGTSIFSSVISTSEAFEVTDMASEMKKAADITASRIMEMQKKERELVDIASSKAEEKRQALLESQREEQISCFKAQAALAAKMAETESDKIRNSKPIGTHGILVEDAPVSQLEVRVFREYFDAMDSDNNGTVSLKELKAYLSNVGLELNQKQLKDMFNEADVDHSGSIDFHEFIAVMKKAKSFDSTPKWRAIEEEITEAIQASLKGGLSPLKKRALTKDAKTPTGRKGGKKAKR